MLHSVWSVLKVRMQFFIVVGWKGYTPLHYTIHISIVLYNGGKDYENILEKLRLSVSYIIFFFFWQLYKKNISLIFQMYPVVVVLYQPDDVEIDF